VFRADLLPISQTFIRDQTSALRRWQPILVGFREIQGGLSTPGIAREIVRPESRRILETLRFWFSRPYPPLVERLRALQVDLVHVHFGTDATEIWPSVKAAGLPMLVTLHGYDINTHPRWWQAGHGGFRRRVYPRRLLKMARDPAVRFVAVSKALRRRAVEYGIPEAKISVGYVGVDTQRFEPGGLPLPQRRKRILFVGRLVEKKAPLLMVRAFAALRRDLPDVELTMVGDGPLLNATKRLAEELSVPVQFLGAGSWQDVRTQLQEARVLCLPSVTAPNGDAEGFGLVILEAQACGVPVVTSALGGAEEGLLPGVTGFACREGAVSELVAGLRKLLCDDAVLASASAAAAHFARSAFDIRHCSGALEFLYQQCATQRSHA
jgi:glycosyltransferase involved in cell wall biosynthesis